MTFQEAQNQVELECEITISNYEQSSGRNQTLDKFQELVQRCNANMWPPQLTVNFIPQALLQRLKGFPPLWNRSNNREIFRTFQRRCFVQIQFSKNERQ